MGLCGACFRRASGTCRRVRIHGVPGMPFAIKELQGRRILMVVSRHPMPTITGDRVRTLGIAYALAQSGAEITIVCPAIAPYAAMNPLLVGEGVYIVGITTNKTVMGIAGAIIARCFDGLPFQAALFPQNELADYAEEGLNQGRFDLCIVQLARLVPLALRLARNHRVVMDMVDLLSINFERRSRIASWPLKVGYKIESKRLRKAEEQIAICMPVVLANSVEGGTLLNRVPDAKDILLVTNGVGEVSCNTMARSTDLIFSGNLAYEPNERAVERIVNGITPALRKLRSDVSVEIAGATPRQGLSQMIVAGGATLMANVPSVSERLLQAKILVAPIDAATGVQNKVLEAMAAGCVPVVSKAAVSGIPGFVHGLHGLCAEDDDDFALAIDGLLSDHGRWESLSAKGIEFATQTYSWTARVQPLVKRIVANDL